MAVKRKTARAAPVATSAAALWLALLQWQRRQPANSGAAVPGRLAPSAQQQLGAMGAALTPQQPRECGVCGC